MTTRFTHRNLPGLLLQAREALMTQRRPALREHGLSDQQWRVLRVLDRHGCCTGQAPEGEEGVETGLIAREAQLLGPSLSGVLQRMERDGLVLRQRSAQDARRSVVRATARGRELLQALALSVEAQYALLEQQLGADRLLQLYDLLDAVVALSPVATPDTDATPEEEPTDA